ncbi:MAG: hypothetical protein JST00_27105 [Deltaproteobacteria bacterium]|nr:hypothetical protein [Deltaproteobacteria bacterium]
MHRPTRLFLAASLAALAISHAPTARASGGVLPPAASADPTVLDVQIAVTKPTGSPALSTRWSRLTVDGVSSVTWLVPIRPGAAVDYATDAWLDSLDDATAVRIAPPAPGASASCDARTDVERIPTWGGTSTKRFPKDVTVLSTEAEARAHATSRELRLGAEIGARLHDAYAKGWAFVAFDIASPSGAPMSSPTVRVRDDGGLLPGGAAAVVPLALTGVSTATTRITAWVIGEGGAELPGTRDLDPSTLTWGTSGSSYVAVRAGALGAGGGTAWIRESASDRAFWNEQLLPKGAIAPLYASYFRNATGQSRAGCETAALGASSNPGAVGRACAPGAVAKLAGGIECAPDAGAIDPGSFACGQGVDDLALALSGSSPANVVATRFVGIVGPGSFGADLGAAPSATRIAPLQTAAKADCASATPVTPPSSGSLPAPSGSGSSSTSDEAQGYWHRTESCGGGTVVVYTDDDSPPPDDGCGGSTTTSSSSSSSSSSSDSSGWDDDDDDDSSDSSSTGTSTSTSTSSDDDDDSSSDDSCSKKSSSSSSSSSSSGSSNDDGWDSSDMSPKSYGMKSPSSAGDSKKSDKATKAKKSKGAKKSKASHAKKTSGRSPVSRYALLFVALVLPLRRRLRNAARKL